MADQTRLDDLIAALEQAPCPDEKLDADIFAYLVGGVVQRSPFNMKWCVYRDENKHGMPRLWEPSTLAEQDLYRRFWNRREFTASIDHALALCLPRFGWGLESDPDFGRLVAYTEKNVEWGRCYARTWPDGRPMGKMAATEPLALCLAFMRIRKSFDENGELLQKAEG